MSAHRTRVQALQALLAGSQLGSHPSCGTILGEFAEVSRAGRIRRQGRRQLLQVLHSTRALDTSLHELIAHHNLPRSGNSLGGYLVALCRHNVAGVGRLPDTNRRHYQARIVGPRNRYMHEAGAFPDNDMEIQTLLAEMQTCLVEVLSL